MVVAFVIAADVDHKFVPVRLVVEAFVITEEDAYIFCAKRLRKRREFVPSDRAMSVVGKISAATLSAL